MSAIPWTPEMVSNALGYDEAAIRNYLEHRLVREATGVAVTDRPIRVAYDVGAGYGRLACVLTEFAANVVAFERDARLLGKGRLLNPNVTFIPVSSLTALPAQSASGDFALTFTVLQHLTDASCRAVIGELKRIVGNGHVLLVEDTDEAHADYDLPHDETGMCRHRTVAQYEKWMTPFRLVRKWPRRVEPTYPQSSVGTAMLFSAAQCS
ncbi:MAG: class I SAM-dependent methyltransferase [Gemmataceae bacterium]|nr:class I SAM-dependent methyltransferase [Gemmataceae bacterium]MCI0743178.1 class I SAM-dependent methyltransferase [Gemmataceae bacterium]